MIGFYEDDLFNKKFIFDLYCVWKFFRFMIITVSQMRLISGPMKPDDISDYWENKILFPSPGEDTSS